MPSRPLPSRVVRLLPQAATRGAGQLGAGPSDGALGIMWGSAGDGGVPDREPCSERDREICM
jgi:hypothetical protein